MQKAAAVGDICTVLDFTPSETFPGTMSAASCKSATGFLLTMPITTSTGDVHPAPLADDMFVGFESADCTGTPRVVAAQVGDFGLSQGAVFSLYETETASLRTVYVAPGSAGTDFQYNSSLARQPNGDWTCTANATPGAEVSGVTPIDNGPSVTGVEDSYAGPISMF